MSGIALAFQCERGSVDRDALARMVAALAHRGGAARTWEAPGIALACLHRGLTPQDAGDAQPFALAGGNAAGAFDGRLDNRDELAAALGLAPAEARELPDSAYVAAAFGRWGEDAFARLVGPFALVIADRSRQRLLLVRDAIGDRSFYYAESAQGLFAASEPAAVAAACGSWSLDRRRLAAWFALHEPPFGSTFFAGVHEVPPAHLLVADASGSRLRRYWQPREVPVPRGDAERAALFREVLDAAVTSRMRSIRPPAALLSGGLDSAPMAVLAARDAERDQRGNLRTVSWVFNRHRDSDERRFVDALAAAAPLDCAWLEADDLGPRPESWPLNPNTPEETPYRAVMDAAYRRAVELGSDVLLAGTWGDDLYWGGDAWWWELLGAGRVGAALREGRLAFGALGTRRFVRACLLRPLLPAPVLARLRSPLPLEWLTPEAAALLDEDLPSAAGRRPAQQRVVMSPGNAHYAASETRLAAQAGVELRYPFRDRRLVELALALPAYELYRGATTRPILRRAFAELLPPAILARDDKASLDPLYRAGVAEAADRLQALLRDGEPSWGEYVRRDWLQRAVPGRRESPQAELVVWHALCLAIWRARMVTLSIH